MFMFLFPVLSFFFGFFFSFLSFGVFEEVCTVMYFDGVNVSRVLMSTLLFVDLDRMLF